MPWRMLRTLASDAVRSRATSGWPKASLSLRTFSLAAMRLSISAPPDLRSEVRSPDEPLGMVPPSGIRSPSEVPSEMSIALSPSTPRPPTRATQSVRTRAAKDLDISTITSIFLSPRSGEKEMDTTRPTSRPPSQTGESRLRPSTFSKKAW
jgi:hypothetical protein